MADLEKNPGLFINSNYDFVNPKAGLSYSLHGARVYASYSYAAKEPNRDDFEAGVNQQPRPEKMHDIEAGFEKETGKLGVVSECFFHEIQRPIDSYGKNK